MGNKKDISKQIKAFQLQAQNIMNDTAVPIEERIQRTADIYQEAENLAEEGSLEQKAYESLLTDSSRFYAEYGMYKDALPRYLQLIDLRESLYGQEHPDTASAYHDVGEIYRNLCDFHKAFEYHKKALDIREKLLGEKHAQTAESYNNMALVYYNLGDYDKASEYIFKAKDIREEVVGNDHPDMADSYVNVSYISYRHDDFSQALEFYTKAKDIYEKTLGEEAHKAGIAYYCLGVTYLQLAEPKEAIRSCCKAVTVLEKVLGLDHPDTALAYLGRGYLGLSLGIKSNASDYEYKALSIFEKAFGCDHLLTASCYNALGWLKYTLGDNNEAIAYSEKSMHIIEKLLGKEHIDTADAYHSLGLIYYELDNYEKACEYISMALNIYQKLPTFENKIKEIEKDMEKAEYKHQHKAEEDEMEYYLENMDVEEKKGTRDLFLETLTAIGCQYEIDENDEINFAYQGEYFVVRASNDNQYIQIYDLRWLHVELYDIDEITRLKKAINESNIRNSVTTVYTIDEAGSNVNVHSKSVIYFDSVIPNVIDYLRLELAEYFNVHQMILLEMTKMRDQEQAKDTIEN
jgi:tetratricopeptide (TPR) repeat protein